MCCVHVLALELTAGLGLYTAGEVWAGRWVISSLNLLYCTIPTKYCVLDRWNGSRCHVQQGLVAGRGARALNYFPESWSTLLHIIAGISV